MPDVLGARPPAKASCDDAPLPPPPGAPAHEVFVSYSHRDKPVADAVVSHLEQAGIRCWVAPRDVIPGRVWGEAIVQAIETTRLMVVILSDEANHSRQVLREVERAVASDVVVVPFRIETFEPTGAMAYYLASEHWLDAMTTPLERHIARLVEVAQALLGTPRVQAAPPPAPTPAAPAPRPSRRRAWVVVGAALVAIAVLGAVAAVLLVSGGAPEPQRVSMAGLATGDCLLTPSEYAESTSRRLTFWQSLYGDRSSFDVVPCEYAHGAEVYFVGDPWPADAEYPGDAAVDTEFWTACERELQELVGVAPDRAGFDVSGWVPDVNTWAEGDREIICLAYDVAGNRLQGTVAESR
jgi:hypothetical protein